jgi:serine/threonine-protein kinase RsbW
MIAERATAPREPATGAKPASLWPAEPAVSTHGQTAAAEDTVLAAVMVPGRSDLVPALRNLVGRLLAGHPAVDDIRLMTTEIISNAIRHSRSGQRNGTLTVRVLDIGHAIRVEVTDEGSATSRPHHHSYGNANSQHGYGLHLVSALATTWQSTASGEGNKTWFEI